MISSSSRRRSTKRIFSAANAEVVTVKVGRGESETDFTIHSSLVRTQSTFFCSALGGLWAESKDRIIKLPEDDPDIFAIYVTWLYQHIIATSDGNSDEDHDEEASILIPAYGLGEQLGDNEFCDAIVDVLVDICNMRNMWLSYTDTKGIYDACLPDSPLRKFVVDLWMLHSKCEWVDKSEDNALLDKQFLLDFLKASICRACKDSPDIHDHEGDDQEEDDDDVDDDEHDNGEDSSLRSVTVPWRLDACAYHRHLTTGRPCYRTNMLPTEGYEVRKK